MTDGVPLSSFSRTYGRDLRAPPTGSLFLYLEQPGWASAWLDGGELPMRNARRYRALERNRTQTPDEVHQRHWSGASREQLFPGIVLGGNNVGLVIKGFSNNGELLPDTYVDDFEEGAIILCFSQVASREIMEKLGKKVCVEIIDFEGLLTSVREVACGREVRFGPVQYADGADRSHFLKGEDDSWMSEYRIAIPSEEQEITIEIPSVARPITL